MSIGSERIFLAALSENPSLMFEYDGQIINENDFSTSETRTIYSTIKNITYDLQSKEATKPIDSVLLEQKVSALNPTLYKVKQKTFEDIIKGIKSTSNISNIDKHVKIIITESIKRKVKSKIFDISGKIESLDDPFAVISHLENEVADLTQDIFHDEEIRYLGDTVDQHIAERVEKAESGQTTVGIKTLYPKYDEAIGMLREGSVNLIMARSGGGKSFLADNLAINIASQDVNVLYLDTELTREYQTDRYLSILSGVDMNRLETGRFIHDQKEIDSISKAQKDLKKMLIDHVVINGWDIAKQISLIRRWFVKRVGKDENDRYKPAVVILDYLKIMSQDDVGRAKEYEALGYMTSALHNLMVQYNSSMILFAQQNRDGTQKDDITTIAGSDRITWFVSSVATLSLRDYSDIVLEEQHNKENRINTKVPNMRLKVVKSRFGKGTGSGWIGFYSDLKDPKSKVSTGKFSEIKFISQKNDK